MNEDTPALAWTRWSEELRRRYARFSERYLHPAMTLLELAGPQPGARETIMQVFHPILQLSIRLPGVGGATVGGATIQPVLAWPGPARSEPGRAERMPASSPTENRIDISPPPGTIGPMILASRLLPESSLRQTAIAEPLARVFARAQGGERDKLDRERADPGSLLVLRRVIEERGRVEERMPPVVMSHPRSSDAHARGRESETVISQSPRGPRVGAPGMAQNPSLANLVDLDRLTDQVVRQIDSRIVAHRERTGNLF